MKVEEEKRKDKNMKVLNGKYNERKIRKIHKVKRFIL